MAGTFVPYATVAQAAAYFLTKLSKQVGPWNGASGQDQTNSLLEATRIVDTLNFAGNKFDTSVDSNGIPNQANQFPRGTDQIVPDDVVKATCEVALKLLDDVDLDMEAENIGLVSYGTGDARVHKDPGAVQEHVRAGIPSLRAWLLLKPYIVDPRYVIMSRGGVEPALGDSPAGTSVVQGFDL